MGAHEVQAALHCCAAGVFRELLAANLLPKVFTGSSAGSIGGQAGERSAGRAGGLPSRLVERLSAAGWPASAGLNSMHAGL